MPTPENKPQTQSSSIASPTRPLWVYHAMALVTVLIWSFSFLHIIILNEAIDPVSLVVLRKDIFAIGLIALLLWRRPKLGHLTRRQWGLVIAMSLVAGPMYHFTFAWSTGEGRIDVALLGLIIATVPIHTGWMGWLFLKEKLTLIKVIALALGLLGVITVIVGRRGGIDLLPEEMAGPIGAMCAAMLAAGGSILTRACRSALGPLDLFSVTGAILLITIVPFHAMTDFQRIGEMSPLGWWAAVYLGVFGSGIAYFAWVAALSGLQALNVAMYLFLASILAALWGWIFRGETIGWPFALGGVLVLTGLALPALGKST
ncbi:MAG: DMT family transporter [Planctomycetes bacterium]|nr:DMT family transporter [Planctomycetota bacterium]